MFLYVLFLYYVISASNEVTGIDIEIRPWLYDLEINTLILHGFQNNKITTYKHYVLYPSISNTGLQAVALGCEDNPLLHENIAIATFGMETKVVMYLTKDYEGLIAKIGI